MYWFKLTKANNKKQIEKGSRVLMVEIYINICKSTEIWIVWCNGSNWITNSKSNAGIKGEGLKTEACNIERGCSRVLKNWIMSIGFFSVNNWWNNPRYDCVKTRVVLGNYNKHV